MVISDAVDYIQKKKELDDRLDNWADQHLSLTAALGVGDGFQAVRQNSHKNHDGSVVEGTKFYSRLAREVPLKMAKSRS